MQIYTYDTYICILLVFASWAWRRVFVIDLYYRIKQIRSSQLLQYHFFHGTGQGLNFTVLYWKCRKHRDVESDGLQPNISYLVTKEIWKRYRLVLDKYILGECKLSSLPYILLKNTDIDLC